MIDMHTIYLLQEDWLQQCLNYCSYVVDCIENRNWLFQGIENNSKWNNMLEKKNISRNIRAVDKNKFYAGSGSILGLSYGPTPPPPKKKKKKNDNLFQGETKQRI